MMLKTQNNSYKYNNMDTMDDADTFLVKIHWYVIIYNMCTTPSYTGHISTWHKDLILLDWKLWY
jgi:hypothetical protein